MIKPVEQTGSAAPWWMVHGKECEISIEARPHYCDRGNWIATRPQPTTPQRRLDAANARRVEPYGDVRLRLWFAVQAVRRARPQAHVCHRAQPEKRSVKDH